MIAIPMVEISSGFLVWLISLARIATTYVVLTPAPKKFNILRLQDHELHQQPSPTQVQRSISTH